MQIEPIDLTQIVVAIITSAGVVYAAWRGRKEQEERREPKPIEGRPSRRPAPLRIALCLGLVLLAANLGVFGWRYWAPTTTGITTGITSGITTEVKITYPYDGSSVEMIEMIRGTSRGIPEGQVIWVVVFPHVTGRYYPQDYPADLQENGDWSSRAYIGVQGDVGLKFDIIVVVLDEEAQSTFIAYLTEASDKKTWPGLEELPDGAVIYDRITVTRQ